MEPIQTMPAHDAMLNEAYTLRQFLNFYKNIWTRNLAAYLIDVETDTELKKKDAEAKVEYQATPDVASQFIPVKYRLEQRKTSVRIALKHLQSIDALLALSPEDLAARYSPEALAVDPEVLKEAEAQNGKGDVAQESQDGKTEGDQAAEAQTEAGGDVPEAATAEDQDKVESSNASETENK